MYTFILVVHILLAAAITFLVLIQKGEGGLGGAINTKGRALSKVISLILTEVIRHPLSYLFF